MCATDDTDIIIVATDDTDDTDFLGNMVYEVRVFRGRKIKRQKEEESLTL